MLTDEMIRKGEAFMENVLKPGRDLDALVAEKVMGWKIYEPYTRAERSVSYPHVTDHAGEQGYDFLLWVDENKNGKRWRPSTSISDAWKVVECIRKKIPEVGSVSLFGSGKDWHVEIDSNDGRFLQNGPTIEVYAQAETAPHAICLAALKAVSAI
jgi:hypothetical protein